MPQTAPRARRAAATLAIALLPLLFHPAHAGPLRERLQQRAAERAAAQAPDELGEREGAGTGRERIALPPGTRVLRDLAYGADRRQRIDVYLPAQPQGAPVLFMVHGGAWKYGDKQSAPVVQNKLAHWVPQGAVLVSVNYRMLPEADPLRQAHDVARALAFAQQQAPSWGADPGRFIALGHSAGAHLVALLAAAPEILRAEGARAPLGTVALDSAALDVPALMNTRHLRLYDEAFGADPAGWQAASPLQQLRQPAAPLLAVCSTRRRTSCAQAEAFQARAATLGMRVELLPQDLAHGEINERLGLPDAYTDAVNAFLRTVDGGFAPHHASGSQARP